MPRKTAVDYLICVKNDGYPASLEIHKVYQSLADASAAAHKMVRIIDESGEDYLFPASYFAAVVLPPAVKKGFARRSRLRSNAQKRSLGSIVRKADEQLRQGKGIPHDQFWREVERSRHAKKRTRARSKSA